MAATVWKGHLSFGLVSIPVRLYRAARAEKVSFRQLHRRAPEVQPTFPESAFPRMEPTPIRASGGEEGKRYARFDDDRRAPEATPGPARSRGEDYPRVSPSVVTPVRSLPASAEDAPISREEILKGYEYQPDQYVLVSKEELRSITPKTSNDIQISEFVHLLEIDPVYLETSYYVEPEPGGEKPYALLYRALRQTGYVALAQIAMHRREHIAIIRPGERGILMHTMYYTNEVRKDQEFAADLALVAPRELDLAIKLIGALAGKFEPEKFRDKYREQVEALIAAKIEGRDVVAGEGLPAATAPVADIMDALKKSLAAARKPAARAETADSRTKPQKRDAKSRRVKGAS